MMEVLLRIWLGHSTEGITDRYTVESLKRDGAYRKVTQSKQAWVSTCLWQPEFWNAKASRSSSADHAFVKAKHASEITFTHLFHAMIR